MLFPSLSRCIYPKLNHYKLLSIKILLVTILLVITSGYIEDLDDEERLLEDEYPYYGVTEEECDRMGEMCDPYEGLQV